MTDADTGSRATIAIEYRLSPSDFAAYWCHLVRHVAPFKAQYRLGLAGVTAASAMLMWRAAQPGGWRVAYVLAAALAGAVAYLALYPAVLRATAHSLARLPGGAQYLGRHSLTLDEDGIREVSDTAEHRHRWGAVQDVFETAAHLFIRVGFGYAYVIPKGSFTSPDAARRFREEAATRVRLARAAAPANNELHLTSAAPTSDARR